MDVNYCKRFSEFNTCEYFRKIKIIDDRLWIKKF